MTSQDIASLADDDLRTLIAWLCEATLRRCGQPSSVVTSGGHQDAPDGGIDVRVNLPPDTPVIGFIPRPSTGFQVKKPGMTPTDIRDEMRPGGAPRSAIHSLAAAGGAYVIVSSGAHLTDSALASRRSAMRAAVADLPGSDRLALDFYDRQRLATWVRDHPGLAPWARARAGRPITGWQSHGAWSYAPGSDAGEYLLDDGVRLHGVFGGTRQELTAAAGLDAVRSLLAEPGRVVRLIGLSGVGKTRLAQALFDARIGAEALDPALALYADLGDGPDPAPATLATWLNAGQQRATLVVDNCGADLHSRLAAIARSPGSAISVVTIEYDVADDQPEGTEVFRLEPASVEVVSRLVRLRFPDLSPVNVDTIADASGGNARIALALGDTVGRGENLAGLSNRDLFQRLFQQRHPHDAHLLAAAEACSLLYSFDGETLAGEAAELSRLAALAGLPVSELYRHVGELKHRGLVQSRSRWRAILPHAIANHLAGRALDRMPARDVEEHLVCGPARTMQSFSRRLGYLHGTAAAVRIAEEWLEPAGLLGDAAGLNGLSQAIFANIAPLAPRAALAALERAAEDAGAGLFSTVVRRTELARLLRLLAFDAALFERSAILLVHAALAEEPDSKVNSVVDLFASLFPILLSGTHASPDQRAQVIDGLLRSDDPRRQGLGLKALNAALEAGHFASFHGFRFGARLRDHGWEPCGPADVQHWFVLFVRLCRHVGCSDLPTAQPVRKLLAERFVGVWAANCACDALEDAARAFSTRACWNDGWIALRQGLSLYRDDLEPQGRERLQALVALLAPRSLAERVTAYVLSDRSPMFDGMHDEAGDGTAASIAQSVQRTQSNIEALGRELASDQVAFKQLRPGLVRRKDDAAPLWHLGKGLGEAAARPGFVWDALATELGQTPEVDASPTVLCGFLDGLQPREPGRVAAMLDKAVRRKGLARWLPTLQAGLVLDRIGMARLHQALRLGAAPIFSYQSLAY